MADFRPIAPFTQPTDQPDQSSTSSSAKQSSHSQESSGGTSGSGVAGAAGSHGNQSSAGSSRGSRDGTQRRRRVPGLVSSLACTECRRARAKCDGIRPRSCHRCIQRELQCVYESHTKTHKNDLLREIEEMKAEHAGLQAATDSLQKDKAHLQTRDETQSLILDVLSYNGHDLEIVQKLRAGEEREAVAEWLLGQPNLRKYTDKLPASQKSLLDLVERVENLYSLKQTSMAKSLQLSHSWTSVTENQALVGHLLHLYFTWVHPVHMLFNEDNFVTSFRSGDEEYCSRPLINAMCAMGCHLLSSQSDKSGSKAKERVSESRDVMSLRDQFMDEARRLLTQDQYSKMTSIQAFAVMFLSELSSGQARRASSYLRCAADNLIETNAKDSWDNSQQQSYWGVHTLNTAWSGFTYQKPFSPESPKSEVYLENYLNQNSELHQWRFYRQPGDENDVPGRPGHVFLTALYQARLFRIVHHSIVVYCGARGRITAEGVIQVYQRYVDWIESLPPPIKNTDVSSQPLPHVLSLHIQYHTAMTQLLAPLLQCQYFSENDSEELRRMMVNHAKRAYDLMTQSTRLYSCRFHAPLTTLCLLHVGDVLMRHGIKELSYSVPTVAKDFLYAMQETRSGFAVCGPLQQMYRLTLKSQGIPLPDDIDDHMGPDTRYDVDDLLDSCTRLSYTQPVEHIAAFFHPEIAEEWQQEWQKQSEQSREQKKARYLHIQSLLNE